MKNLNLSRIGLFLVGLILSVAGLALCYYNYHSSYAQSKAAASSISSVKAQIEEAEASVTELENQMEELKKQPSADTAKIGEITASLENMKSFLSEKQAERKALSDQKLSLEKPYSYSLILLFSGLIFCFFGVRTLLSPKAASRMDTKKLAQAALCAALCYIGFTFFKIDIPVGTEKTAFHFGNVFCVLAALLVGGFWGGMAGAVGMTLADLTTSYVTSAPKTFLLKLCIGLIVGLVAHKICHITKEHTKKYVAVATILASAAGMTFNIVADPVVGYFYKTYLLGVPQELSSALAKISAVTTSVNAVIAVIAASILYLAMRPAFKKAGLFVNMH